MPRDLAPRAPRPMMALDPAFALLAYVGGPVSAALSALRALVRPAPGAAPLRPAVARRLDETLVLGLPLVALAHVPLGSFLAMQAFYNATFTEAVGAVVGLGLLRNLATMTTGLLLAGYQAARIVPELRNRPRAGLDDDPEAVPDRDVARGVLDDARAGDDPGRIVLVRILSALVAGPVLSLAGMLVGTGIGMLVGRSMVRVAPAIFVGKFLELLQPIDVVGLVVKGAVFAAIGAAASCAEGLRKVGPESAATPAATCRAACLAMVGILFLNGVWFSLAYRSGHPFGPTIGR